MQHKRCWQAAVMNWWAIFSCDPSSAAGAVPQRGRPDNLRWGPGAGGTSWAGRWACTGPRPALWSGSSRMADGGLCELELCSHSSAGRSKGSNQLGFESSQIIWLLSLQVPPVNSELALPDGKTDNAQYVLVHSMWQTHACHKWSSRSRLQILNRPERGSPLAFLASNAL